MILQAENIVKTYTNGVKRLTVLDGVNLSIGAGDIITIMGPSGSGKSTLLNILGTLDNPTSGTVVIDGNDISAMPDKDISVLRNNYIGFVFQFHHLLPEFTALENILIPLMISGIAKPDRSRALDLLDYVGLTERMDHYPSELSGGERSRIAVLRALINQPRIIFADEPTGNLDEYNASKLIELLKKINTDFEHSIILTTHNPVVAQIGNINLTLEAGKIKTG
ncbi:MAG: ABC transporter ATP-binding protein [Candidatus Marinimicrobia bacterium]|nr:ABC transporter ATP-binding protein [Candidatus Neomarinimicrobiota bacterium]